MIINQDFKAVHPNARIGNNVTISPFVTIEEDVQIGDDCWIGPHVTIMNGATIGSGCKIFPGAVVGAEPQDLKYGGEETFLKVGNNVTIREYCTLNRGTKADGITEIGDNCLLMAYVHVAHDCKIKDHVVLVNSVNLGGHVEIDSHAIVAGMSAVHQFVKIGKHVMIGGGTMLRKDAPPFVKASGDPAKFMGVNSIGLKRRGFTDDQVNHISNIYRILFIKGLPVSKALEQIKEEIPSSSDKELILSFIADGDRGLIKGFQTSKNGNSH